MARPAQIKSITKHVQLRDKRRACGTRLPTRSTSFLVTDLDSTVYITRNGNENCCLCRKYLPTTHYSSRNFYGKMYLPD